MRYIEETDNEKLEYEVIINDVEKFQNVINLLDEECSYEVKKTTNVTGRSIDEVMKKINCMNTTGFRVIGEVQDQDVYIKGQHMYKCELTFKQLSMLSGILTSLLNNYNSNRDVSLSVNNLLRYENSIEIRTYLEKMEKENNPELCAKYELVCAAYKEALACLSIRPISKTTYYGTKEESKTLGKR